ncbi:hypothetical protein HMPREF1986_02604 [Oribacterium sp. oral taxon 078 str. F0263]|nr:hypothetical protein HMPREF1986_02604 [Oribacterium sp. oral taxon 078 str. F0263]
MPMQSSFLSISNLLPNFCLAVSEDGFYPPPFFPPLKRQRTSSP